MDPAANIKVSKKTSVERIDPLAAIITAMAAWMNEGNATSGPSVYEDQGKAIEWV
jgi:phage terminase large subunit-like protein